MSRNASRRQRRRRPGRRTRRRSGRRRRRRRRRRRLGRGGRGRRTRLTFLVAFGRRRLVGAAAAGVHAPITFRLVARLALAQAAFGVRVEKLAF